MEPSSARTSDRPLADDAGRRQPSREAWPTKEATPAGTHPTARRRESRPVEPMPQSSQRPSATIRTQSRSSATQTVCPQVRLRDAAPDVLFPTTRRISSDIDPRASDESSARVRARGAIAPVSNRQGDREWRISSHAASATSSTR